MFLSESPPSSTSFFLLGSDTAQPSAPTFELALQLRCRALLVALVATVDAAFTFTADDIESEEALWELFGRWAAYHEVVREPGRFAAFKANVQWRWSKQRHSGRPMALNVFGDRSFDELAPQSCLKCAADPCPPD